MIERDFWQAADDELTRARAMFPNQELTLALADWCSILTEEVGEVARACNEHLLGRVGNEDTTLQLAFELVQVAAMAGRMASSLHTSPELTP